MEKTRNAWQKIFMALGIVFACIILLIIGGLIALMIIKPYGIDIMGLIRNPSTTEPYDHPMLSPDQEQTLQNLGIDPASLPTTLTEEQMDCAVKILGAERANEILSGASPTAMEIYKLQGCF